MVGPKKRNNLLLFDVDGVIVDSFDIVYEGVRHFIEQKGGDAVTQEQFRDSFNGNALKINLELAGLSDSKELTEDDLKVLFAGYEKTSIVEGMSDVLAELAEHNTLVVITSTHIEPITAKFEEVGIHDLFAAYLGPMADASKNKKVVMAMEEFGPNTDEVYFISDTLGDLLEVKDIGGLKRVGVSWGYHDYGRLEKAMADYIADTPEQLLKYLTS